LRTLITHARSRFASALWSAVANALPRAALLVAGLYVARRFGADSFAHYSLAIVTVTLAGSLVATAMTNLGGKHVPEAAHRPQAGPGAGHAALLAQGIGLAVLLGAVVCALAPYASGLFRASFDLTGLLRVAALVVVATVVNGTFNGLMAGAARFRAAAISTAIGAAAFAILLSPLADAWGIEGVLAALGVLYVATAACEAWAVRREARADLQAITGADFRGQLRRTSGFLLPLLVFNAMIPAVVWLCNLLLTRGATPVPEIARFNAAYNWYAVAVFVPNVMAQVEFIHLSQAKARGETAALGRLLRLAMLQNLAVMLPLALVGIAAAGPLMDLFRVNDADGRATLQWMLAAAFIASLGTPTGLFFAVIDRIWLATGLNALWAAITLACAWVLRDRGATGAAAAFAIAYGAHALIAGFIAFRHAGRLRRATPAARA
jgi:O-antigen/teichoic acid export membrane protein